MALVKLEMVIELHKGLLKKIWGARTQQMVDLVVRQTTSKQSKLNLRIVHLSQNLTNTVERLEFLGHEVRCEVLVANGSAK